ncbi:hypothetical protein [Rhodococcus erythropolis]|uniref:Uncharacterized protein n=1 Tax=Rhodococcus erythropolis TaxID=1833 RepID=A0A8I0ZZS4_RHOER|nr:hypothetical protein [Rhodococcus erythropolis]MBH5143465.1 hypothetical protein [Rhodococcus erythropolis]
MDSTGKVAVVTGSGPDLVPAYAREGLTVMPAPAPGRARRGRGAHRAR